MRNICIVGPSGTGKTTLAKYISSRYRIDYITGSSRGLSKEFNINSHQDMIKLCANDPMGALDLYMGILNYREEISETLPMVTDRGIIDLIVYFTIQLAPFLSLYEVEKFMGLCINVMDQQVTPLYIFTRYNFEHAIDEDDRRIVSLEYQALISHAFDIYIKKYLPKAKILILDSWNWDNRVKIVDNYLSKNKYVKFKTWLKEKLKLKQ
jgi:ABC-type dipeptide/oligopeptide/nickel transport system ATPase subunit